MGPRSLRGEQVEDAAPGRLMKTGQLQIPSRGMKLRANWGASVVERIEECAAEISRLQKASPLTSKRGGESQNSTPFTLRWFGMDVGVYIPSGSVTLANTTIMMSNIEFNGEPVADWYEVTGIPHANTTCTITAHVKARVKGSGDESEHPAIYVSSHTGAEPSACVGDIMSIDIGTANFALQQITQSTSGKIIVMPETPKPLDLYWTLSGTTLSPVVKACTFSIGSVNFQLASDTSISSPYSNIYLNIACAGSTPLVSVSSTGDNSVTSLSILLYVLTSGGGILSDNRSALSSSVYYP